jgi:hypothetical protein
MGEGRAGEGAQKSEKIYGKWTKFAKINNNLGKTYKNREKRRGKLGGYVVYYEHLVRFFTSLVRVIPKHLTRYFRV